MTIFKDFELLDNVEKLSYMLGSELWESKFFCHQTTINQLEANVSLITNYCLRLFVVVYQG